MSTLRFANVLMNSILFNMLTVATAVATVTKTDTVCQKVNDEHILHVYCIYIITPKQHRIVQIKHCASHEHSDLILYFKPNMRLNNENKNQKSNNQLICEWVLKYCFYLFCWNFIEDTPQRAMC